MKTKRRKKIINGKRITKRSKNVYNNTRVHKKIRKNSKKMRGGDKIEELRKLLYNTTRIPSNLYVTMDGTTLGYFRTYDSKIIFMNVEKELECIVLDIKEENERLIIQLTDFFHETQKKFCTNLKPDIFHYFFDFLAVILQAPFIELSDASVIVTKYCSTYWTFKEHQILQKGYSQYNKFGFFDGYKTEDGEINQIFINTRKFRDMTIKQIYHIMEEDIITVNGTFDWSNFFMLPINILDELNFTLSDLLYICNNGPSSEIVLGEITPVEILKWIKSDYIKYLNTTLYKGRIPTKQYKIFNFETQPHIMSALNKLDGDTYSIGKVPIPSYDWELTSSYNATGGIIYTLNIRSSRL